MKFLPKMVVLCSIVAAFILCNNKAAAQATLNADTVKAQLIKDWVRVKAYTFAYLNTMPADKYSFKAVDSIRSFAQQMLHLAGGNFGLMSRATGQKSDIAAMVNEKSVTAQTKDSVMYYVGASYDFAISAVTSMDASKLGENVPGPTGPVSRLTWIEKAIEHQTHHRGQATIYIRLLGIKPPNEQLF